jgi:hypothetical protein
MKPFEATTIRGRIYADRELRKIYRESVEQRRREAAEAAAEAERRPPRDPKRLQSFFAELGVEVPDSVFERPNEGELARRRLLSMPAAEAWASSLPEYFNDFNAPAGADLWFRSRL